MSENEFSGFGLGEEKDEFGDIDAILKGSNVLVESEDLVGTDKPHLLFDSQDMLKALNAIAVVVKEGQEIVSRVVMMEPSEGYVILRVNNGEVSAKVRVEYKNNTNVLKTVYMIEFKTLYAVVRNSGARILLMEENGILKVRVLGGEVEFEKFTLDPVLFLKIDEEEKKEAVSKSVSNGGEVFYGFLTNALRSMSLAFRPEDRIVSMDNDKALSNFLMSLVVHKGLGFSATFRSVDLQLLTKLSEGVSTVAFRATSTVNLFESPNKWIVALPKVASNMQSVRQIEQSLSLKSKFIITPAHLYKVLSMLSKILGCSGVVKLKTEAGSLKVAATTSTGKKLIFPIAPARPEDVLDMSTPVSVLISAVLLMKKDSPIDVGVDVSNKLVFEDQSLKIIFGSVV